MYDYNYFNNYSSSVASKTYRQVNYFIKIFPACIYPFICFVTTSIAFSIEALFIEKAKSYSASIYFADKENWDIIESVELPELQKTNLKTALCTLDKMNVPFSEETVQKALQNLYSNTGLFGRLTKLSENPLVYLDVSHNQDGIQATLLDLSKVQFDQLHIVYGASQDKNVTSILSLFPDNTNIHLCEFRNNRSLKEADLFALQLSDPRILSVSKSVNSIVKKLIQEVSAQDLILVTGSFFLLADVDLATFK
jgi:dihydrofolate synthase/folylpolyglutamate synthase